MTTPETPEREAMLERAWRESSAETPSPQLDAAVLAAAHRAVGSAPRDAEPQDAASSTRAAGEPARAATGPQRWWMPLAAAATIGAVALGVLQVAPLERADTAPSVSDMPASVTTAQDRLQPRERKDASPAMAEDSGVGAAPDSGKAHVLTESASPRTISPPVASAMKRLPPTAKIVAPLAADSAAPPAPASLPAPVAMAPQPFPAAKKSEAADAAFAQERANEAPARVAAERDEPRQRNDVAQLSAPAAAGAVKLSKSMARGQTAAAQSVDIDAAIQRIRKLYDDGKLADAAKELIDLRAVASDADTRLPPELRAWAETVKR